MDVRPQGIEHGIPWCDLNHALIIRLDVESTASEEVMELSEGEAGNEIDSGHETAEDGEGMVVTDPEVVSTSRRGSRCVFHGV
jgi:hypothetical protein